MRQYAKNSSESMARILALSMLIDGGIDQSELDIFVRHDVLKKLNLSQSKFDLIVHQLCDDMLQCLQGIHHGLIELDEVSMDGMLNEIQDEQLRRQLLPIMLAIVDADDSLNDNEAILFTRALNVWQLDLVDVIHLNVKTPHNVVRSANRATALLTH